METLEICGNTACRERRDKWGRHADCESAYLLLRKYTSNLVITFESLKKIGDGGNLINVMMMGDTIIFEGSEFTIERVREFCFLRVYENL